MAHNGIRPEGLQSFCSGAVTHPSSCLLAPAADSLQRYPDASCLRHHVYGHTIVRLGPFVKAILQMNLTMKGPSLREALIKSLFAFILEFLSNARNELTRIASYLRKPMTK